MFELNIKANDNETMVIAAKGEIDIYSAPSFKDKLYSWLDDGHKNIVLDFSDLEYIDSMGLGILVGALKRIKERDGKIVVKNPRSTIRKLFKITGLDKVFIMEEAEQ